MNVINLKMIEMLFNESYSIRTVIDKNDDGSCSCSSSVSVSPGRAVLGADHSVPFCVFSGIDQCVGIAFSAFRRSGALLSTGTAGHKLVQTRHAPAVPVVHRFCRLLGCRRLVWADGLAAFP